MIFIYHWNRQYEKSNIWQVFVIRRNDVIEKRQSFYLLYLSETTASNYLN